MDIAVSVEGSDPTRIEQTMRRVFGGDLDAKKAQSAGRALLGVVGALAGGSARGVRRELTPFVARALASDDPQIRRLGLELAVVLDDLEPALQSSSGEGTK